MKVEHVPNVVTFKTLAGLGIPNWIRFERITKHAPTTELPVHPTSDGKTHNKDGNVLISVADAAVVLAAADAGNAHYPGFLEYSSPERNAQPGPAGLSKIPKEASCYLPRLVRSERPSNEGRVHQSRYHSSQEAQFRRTKDCSCTSLERKAHYGLYSRRGPQSAAAQCRSGQGRQSAGLPRCVIHLCQRSFGFRRCGEPCEQQE